MTANIPRCEDCGYALIRGLCPIHAGRQVAERLAMLAPLPKAPEQPESTARVLRFKRRRRP
jgi:hypothetical protein